MQRVCAAHGVSLQAAALQFPLFHPVVAAIIPGAWRAENIRENLASFRAPIPPQFWSDLVAEGLVGRTLRSARNREAEPGGPDREHPYERRQSR